MFRLRLTEDTPTQTLKLSQGEDAETTLVRGGWGGHHGGWGGHRGGWGGHYGGWHGYRGGYYRPYYRPYYRGYYRY